MCPSRSSIHFAFIRRCDSLLFQSPNPRRQLFHRALRPRRFGHGQDRQDEARQDDDQPEYYEHFHIVKNACDRKLAAIMHRLLALRETKCAIAPESSAPLLTRTDSR